MPNITTNTMTLKGIGVFDEKFYTLDTSCARLVSLSLGRISSTYVFSPQSSPSTR